jgi:hypothetical protein
MPRFHLTWVRRSPLCSAFASQERLAKAVKATSKTHAAADDDNGAGEDQSSDDEEAAKLEKHPAKRQRSDKHVKQESSSRSSECDDNIKREDEDSSFCGDDEESEEEVQHPGKKGKSLHAPQKKGQQQKGTSATSAVLGQLAAEKVQFISGKAAASCKCSMCAKTAKDCR